MGEAAFVGLVADGVDAEIAAGPGTAERGLDRAVAAEQEQPARERDQERPARADRDQPDGRDPDKGELDMHRPEQTRIQSGGYDHHHGGAEHQPGGHPQSARP
jgi:hypothetical protein